MINPLSIGARISRAFQAFNSKPMDIGELNKKIDAMIANNTLPVAETKEQPQSALDVRHSQNYLSYATIYNSLARFGYKTGGKNVPPRGDPDRDNYLSDFWQEEPILAGATYSMTAKMSSLGWTVTGKRRIATEMAKMLARAASMLGYDWGGFMSSTSQDFYTTNRGIFWELAKEGNDYAAGKIVDIGHIDSLCCSMTGYYNYPMIYSSAVVGQTLRFVPGQFTHFSSMPSPRERNMGGGLCAVDRCYRAAKMLVGLHNYDEEKLNNLPPEGVAAVTGLTMEEFTDALSLWQEKRKADNSLTFPQVLWLIGSQPNSNVDVKFIGFSQLPESFDRKSVVDQYVNTVALCYGVDVREFWTSSGGGLGSAGESSIQHLKAKGKGPGELISDTERHINGELPDDVDFKFDRQDSEESAQEAAIAKAWVDAFMPLYNLPGAGKSAAPGSAGGFAENGGTPSPIASVTKANPQPTHSDGSPVAKKPMIQGVNTGGAMGVNEGGQPKQAEQVLDKEQFLRLLADKGVIPDYLVSDSRITMASTEVHNAWFKSDSDGEDYTTIEWKGGILREKRLPAIVINSNDYVDAPEATLKEDTLAILIQELREVKALDAS